MAAYLTTLIYGNESFGGYLSVDGEKATAIEDDMTYQIDEGPHRIEIFSTSNAERAAGKFQASVYANTSSSGALFDTLERNQAIKNLGDCWSMDIFIEEGQALVLSVRTNGRNIVAAPSYEIRELTDEQIEYLEEGFQKIEEQRIVEANTPRRSAPKIVWGSILMGVGLMSGSGALSSGAFSASNDIATTIAMVMVFGGMIGVGLILFLTGLRKKVRN